MTSESLPRCFGVLGQPIGHSASPRMHTAAFATLGLPHRYLAFDVSPKGLAAAIRGAAELGLGGLNLTVPHKQAAVAVLDRVDDAAAAIGAVNTVVFHAGETVGYNTDASGFIAGALELVATLPERIVVLGGGGAARAVVRGFIDASPAGRVDWISRDPAKLPPWRGVTPHNWDAAAAALVGCAMLVNATSVGMAKGPSQFPCELPLTTMSPDGAVVDLVYPRASEGLLVDAEAADLQTQDGHPMLLHQGVAALSLWLDRTIPPGTVEAMRAALSHP